MEGRVDWRKGRLVVRSWKVRLEPRAAFFGCVYWDRKVLQRFFGFLLFCADSDEGNKKKWIGKNPNQTDTPNAHDYF